MSVFTDEIGKPSEPVERSWTLDDSEEPDDLTTSRHSIPRKIYVIRPRVFRKKCVCTFKKERHADFYSCWFDRLKQFIEKQKMTDYVDSMTLIEHMERTKAIRIVCTKRAIEKIVVSRIRLNIIGACLDNVR